MRDYQPFDSVEDASPLYCQCLVPCLAHRMIQMCKVVDRTNERYEQYFYHTITTCTFAYTYIMDREVSPGHFTQYEDIWPLDNYLEKLMNCNSFCKYIFAIKHFFFPLSKNLGGKSQ